MTRKYAYRTNAEATLFCISSYRTKYKILKSNFDTGKEFNTRLILVISQPIQQNNPIKELYRNLIRNVVVGLCFAGLMSR